MNRFRVFALLRFLRYNLKIVNIFVTNLVFDASYQNITRSPFNYIINSLLNEHLILIEIAIQSSYRDHNSTGSISATYNTMRCFSIKLH